MHYHCSNLSERLPPTVLQPFHHYRYHPAVVTTRHARCNLYASSIFTAGYIESLNAEKAQLRIGFSDIYKSQVPPWLGSSRTARFLQSANKENVSLLLAQPHRDESIPFDTINDAVYQCMQHTIKAIRPGERESRLSRVARRHLGSFEPGRIQIKPSTPVQEDLTVKRHARSWSLLITVLLCMQLHEWRERFDLQYFNLAADIRLELASVQLRISELYVEDEDACHLHGEDMLQQAIHRLSFLLVRMQSEENPFESLVTQSCAFRTINKEGMWILASEFAPFLSGMIHYMQLWLSAYCIQVVPPSSSTRAIESLIR